MSIPRRQSTTTMHRAHAVRPLALTPAPVLTVPPVPTLAALLAGQHTLSEYALAHDIDLRFVDAATLDEARRAARMRPSRGRYADLRPIAVFALDRTVFINTTWLAAATGTPALARWLHYAFFAACYLTAVAPERWALAIRMHPCRAEDAGIVTKQLPSAWRILPGGELEQTLTAEEAAAVGRYLHD